MALRAALAVCFMCTVLFALIPYGNAQAFTATVKLQPLPARETELIEVLKTYLKTATFENNQTKEKLENFLSQTETANKVAIEDERFVEYPTNAFLLIRRLAEGWGHVTETICGDVNDDSKEKTEYCQKRDSVVRLCPSWPSQDDLTGAALAMVRLADFYQLDFFGLANGTVYGVKMLPLSFDDFMFIANVAADDNQEYLASIWYKKTVNVLEKIAPEDITTKTRMQRQLASLYYKNNMYKKAYKLIEKATENNPHHKGAQRDLKLYSDRASKSSGEEPRQIPRPEFFIDPKVMSTYRRLCRRDLKTPKEQSILHCKYRRTNIPLLFSKLEYANVDPPVVLFHDILTEAEMDHAKKTAAAHLQRSVVGSKKEMSSVRISQTAWLGESDDILLRMSKKVELHTGLSAMSSAVDSHAEPWQVLNYGLGGLYVPHEDSVQTLRDTKVDSEVGAMLNSGDRLATFLFYLTDVAAGGATVFPYLRARVPVVKGGAALWYNLFRNGNRDTRHLHAGCPVLIGSKWASNKWLREIGQTFRRPCALDPHL